MSTQSNLTIPITPSSAVLKTMIAEAVANLDHDKLVALLARTSSPTIKYTNGDLYSLYRGLMVPSSAVLRDRILPLVHCLQALLTDDRFLPPLDQFVHFVMDDRRQLDVVLRTWLAYDTRVTFRDKIESGLLSYMCSDGRWRFTRTIVNQPWFVINKADNDMCRRLHQALDIVAHMVYSPHNLPIILAHPQIDPNVKSLLLFRSKWETPLEIADRCYAEMEKTDMSSEAVRQVRLLLDHDRIDIHTLEECTPLVEDDEEETGGAADDVDDDGDYMYDYM